MLLSSRPRFLEPPRSQRTRRSVLPVGERLCGPGALCGSSL